MPIYEYQCKNCGHQLEIIQKIDEPACTEYPECQQLTLSKKISAAGFQLKGTGWYVTDFKGSGGGMGKQPEPSSSSEKPVVSEKQGSQAGSQES